MLTKKNLMIILIAFVYKQISGELIKGMTTPPPPPVSPLLPALPSLASPSPPVSSPLSPHQPTVSFRPFASHPHFASTSSLASHLFPASHLPSASSSRPSSPPPTLSSSSASTCSNCVSPNARGTKCLAGVDAKSSCQGGAQCCQHCDLTCSDKNKWWSTKDGFCTASGGQCKDNTNLCLGSYARGMCGGPAPRQCCLPKQQFSIKTSFFIIHIILIIFIVIINITVITITIIEKDLHNVPNIFIFSLAVGDLLLGILWTSVEIISYVNQKLITNVDPNLRILIDLANICKVAIIFHILLVTIDRYIAINFPLKHYIWSRNGIITKKKTIIACIIAWCLGIGLSYSSRINKEWTHCEISIIFNTIRTLAPLIITAILNIRIFHVIKNKVPVNIAMESQRDFNLGVTEDSIEQKQMCFPMTFSTQNKKAAWTVSLILISIFLAYFPHNITLVLSVCGQTSPGFYESLDPYFIFGMLVNSLVNPVIYAVTTDQFKSSFSKHVLRKT